MSKSLLRRLAAAVRGSEIETDPKPEVMPGATVEQLAIAIVEGHLRPEDIPVTDPRKVESCTLLIASVQCAESARANPDDPLSSAPLSFPRLQQAIAARMTSEEATTCVPE